MGDTDAAHNFSRSEISAAGRRQSSRKPQIFRRQTFKYGDFFSNTLTHTLVYVTILGRSSSKKLYAEVGNPILIFPSKGAIETSSLRVASRAMDPQDERYRVEMTDTGLERSGKFIGINEQDMGLRVRRLTNYRNGK